MALVAVVELCGRGRRHFLEVGEVELDLAGDGFDLLPCLKLVSNCLHMAAAYQGQLV